MLVIGVIALFLVVTLIDLPSLLKLKSKKKAIVAYLFLLSIGFGLILLKILDQDITSPAIIFEKVIHYFLGK